MPHFFFITGPPAVGKMTVGQALAQKLGYPLFYNHHSIDLTLDLFAWGTPEFKAINSGIRKLVFDTVVDSPKVTGFIFTAVMAFDLAEDIEETTKLRRQFEAANWKFHLVELSASLEVRLARNRTPNRLAHKKSKRDLERSQENLLHFDKKYQLNSDGQFWEPSQYLFLNNSALSAEEAAERVVAHFL